MNEWRYRGRTLNELELRVDVLDSAVDYVVHSNTACLLVLLAHLDILGAMMQRLVQRLVYLEVAQLLAVHLHNKITPVPLVLPVGSSGGHRAIVNNIHVANTRNAGEHGEVVVLRQVNVNCNETLLACHTIVVCAHVSSSLNKVVRLFP